MPDRGQLRSDAGDTGRDRRIDTFRGLTIVLMIFFTLCGLFSDELPQFARHNYPDQFHVGDLILPMFLFSSGMSLVYFEEKRHLLGKRFPFHVIRRVLTLLLTSFSLSFFFTGTLFGLDEVMLNLLLFLPCLALIRLRSSLLIALTFGIVLAHAVGAYCDIFPDLSGVYLGGYFVVPFYLPVMLAGILCARLGTRVLEMMACAFPPSALLLWFLPPLKLKASPSYISLSIVWCFLVYLSVKPVRSKVIWYFGRRPLRFWIFQFLFFVIPCRIYYLSLGRFGPQNGIDGIVAIWAALGGILFLYFLSRILDYVFSSPSQESEDSSLLILDPGHDGKGPLETPSE